MRDVKNIDELTGAHNFGCLAMIAPASCQNWSQKHDGQSLSFRKVGGSAGFQVLIPIILWTYDLL
jgi:hypothetical protein